MYPACHPPVMMLCSTLLTLTGAGDEAWETIQVDDTIHASRHWPFWRLCICEAFRTCGKCNCTSGCSLPHEFCGPRSTGQSNGLIQSSAPRLADRDFLIHCVPSRKWSWTDAHCSSACAIPKVDVYKSGDGGWSTGLANCCVVSTLVSRHLKAEFSLTIP